MRKADWLIAALIAAVLIFGIFFLRKNWPDVANQEHDRPSVAETLDKIGDGTAATAGGRGRNAPGGQAKTCGKQPCNDAH